MASKDVRNYTRLHNVILNRATDVLRNKFKVEWNRKYNEEWNDTSCKKLITDLGGETKIKKSFLPYQKHYIRNGNINDWDITLLKQLLLNESLFSMTTNDEKRVQEVGDIRNKTSHYGSRNMSNIEFEAYSKIVFDALIALGDNEDELMQLKLTTNFGGIAFIDVFNHENIAEANDLKELGNNEFKAKNYSNAIMHYTSAIVLAGLPSTDRAMLYSNRCICYFKLNDLENAEKDAKEIIQLWPQWWKGYYRKAQIYNSKDDYQSLTKAEKYLMQAQALEPKEDKIEINELLNIVREKIGPTDRHELFDARNYLMSAEDFVEYKKNNGININVNIVKKMIELYSAVNLPEHKNMSDCIEGHRYHCGTDDYPLDYKRAFQCYSKAANRGSALGFYNVALMYSEGKGYKQDFDRHFQYLLKAAQQPPYINEGCLKTPNVGVAEAEFVLGLCYEIGKYVTKDLDEAIKWHEKAVEHESRHSANSLGLIYWFGKEFIAKDLDKAEKYFTIAASDDDPHAMMNIVQLYLEKRKPEYALKWCERLRNKGYNNPQIDYYEDKAKQHLRMLENTLKLILGHENINGEYTSEMTIKEIIDRKFAENHPQKAYFLQKLNEIKEKSHNKSKSPFIGYTDPFEDIETLKRYANSGKLYAKKLLNAKLLFRDSLKELNGIKNRRNPSTDECRNFIKLYSRCAQTHMLVYSHDSIERIVKYVLSKSTDYDEDARVCFAAINMKNIDNDIIFLEQCLKLYPKNVYFLITHGSLLHYHKQYEKSIRDFNEALLLSPNDEEILYVKAAEMSFSPQHKNDYHSVVKAFDDFISAAPEDHKYIPECYYKMANLNLFWRKNLIEAKKYFNMGLISEEKQLSFFLPYDSPAKEIVELYLKNESFIDEII